MTFQEIVTFLSENWATILGVICILTPIIWGIIHYLFKIRVDNLHSEINHLRKTTEPVSENNERSGRAATLKEGKWYVYWQYNSRGDWNLDECYLKHSITYTELEVLDSQNDFNWVIQGRDQDRFIWGDWSSRNPGSNAFGTIMLAIEPQGRFMCGYWIGPAKESSIICGKVACALDKQKVKELIKDSVFEKYL